MADSDGALGKLLAWVLRHEPDAIGLRLDPGGWASIDELLAGLADHGRPLTRAELDAEVAADEKRRFTLSSDGTRIRAAQGHSIAIDLGLEPREPPSRLFHGTPERFVASIRESGLVRGKRHDVHLSSTPATAVSVGRRRGRPVVLQIDAGAMHAAGHRFIQSENGVWLTDFVPARFVTVLASADDPGHPYPMPSQDIRLELPELTLAAKAWIPEPPSGAQRVLALHGWLDNAASFDRLAPLLPGLHIVALDLPGHGLSDHKSGVYHFIDSVADVLAAADALGWERFSLLGHSMGAGIATLVAGAAPERIERCALIEGLGPMTDAPELAAKRLNRSLRVEQRTLSRAGKKLHPSRESAIERLLEAAPMRPESAEILIDRGLVELPGGFEWRADSRLRVDSRWRMTEEQVLAFCRAIACPVILIEAEQGWPYPPATMAGRVAAIATIETVKLAGHHHLHLDDPKPVAALVRTFFGPAP